MDYSKFYNEMAKGFLSVFEKEELVNNIIKPTSTFDLVFSELLDIDNCMVFTKSYLHGKELTVRIVDKSDYQYGIEFLLRFDMDDKIVQEHDMVRLFEKCIIIPVPYSGFWIMYFDLFDKTVYVKPGLPNEKLIRLIDSDRVLSSDNLFMDVILFLAYPFVSMTWEISLNSMMYNMYNDGFILENEMEISKMDYRDVIKILSFDTYINILKYRICNI